MERLRDKADEIITKHIDAFNPESGIDVHEVAKEYADYVLDKVYEKLKMDIKTDNIGYNEMLSDKIHELKQEL